MMLKLLYIFALYSILGWVLEVFFFFIKSGRYVKRGILGGPYCPLYGFSIAVCEALHKGLNDNIFFMYIVFGIVCTAFELITAIIFDKILNIKMWDYSNERLNLSGYICLRFSLIWGALATVSVKYLNPLFVSSTDEVSVIIKSIFTFCVIAAMIFNILFYKRAITKH